MEKDKKKKKKKKAKNITTKIFGYIMLVLGVVSAISSVLAYALSSR